MECFYAFILYAVYKKQTGYRLQCMFNSSNPVLFWKHKSAGLPVYAEAPAELSTAQTQLDPTRRIVWPDPTRIVRQIVDLTRPVFTMC